MAADLVLLPEVPAGPEEIVLQAAAMAASAAVLAANGAARAHLEPAEVIRAVPVATARAWQAAAALTTEVRIRSTRLPPRAATVRLYLHGQPVQPAHRQRERR